MGFTYTSSSCWFSHVLSNFGTQYFHIPWLVSSYVPGGNVPSGWDLAGMSPSRHSLKLATREKLAQDLKFHVGVQPWIHCACLGAPWYENWSQRRKDGKCCRSRQASTTAHISGTTVLLSNFWLQTAPKDALGGKACTGRSVPPRG